MTFFTGTTGTDTFVGADFVQDHFFFDATTLSSGDTIKAGGNTGSMADILHLDGGTYLPRMFDGVHGIDAIWLSDASTLIIDDHLAAQGGVVSAEGRLQVRTSIFDDVVDASGVTSNGITFQYYGGTDVIVGTELSDEYYQMAFTGGDVTFNAAGGDDFVLIGTIFATSGVQAFDGGTGVDELTLFSETGLLLDLQSPSQQFDIGDGLITGTLANFERYFAHAETATMNGSAGDDEFHGSDGDDTLFGRAGADTLSGNDGDDIMRGGNGDDTLDGGAGSDTAYYGNTGDGMDVDLERAVDQAVGSGSVGTDQLISIENVVGGLNDDILAGDDLANILKGRSGDDTLLGRDGADTLVGNTGEDTLDGGNDADELRGGYGNDLLLGGDGNDTLLGEGDDDWLDPGIGTDTVSGGAGFDIVDYSDAAVALDVNLFTGVATDGGARSHTIDTVEGVIGGAAGDDLTGNQADNLLEGRDGGDTLNGLAGSDTLIGGSGLDVLIGGTEADVFVFSDTGAGYGDDVVQDFEDGIDVLHFQGVDSVQVNDVGANAQVTMYDAGGNILDTVVLLNVAGLVDASDYVLWA